MYPDVLVLFGLKGARRYLRMALAWPQAGDPLMNYSFTQACFGLVLPDQWQMAYRSTLVGHAGK
jgi:hypothetical protein